LKYSSAGDVRNISVTFDVKFKVEDTNIQYQYLHAHDKMMDVTQ
jgi:hypothetical protein